MSFASVVCSEWACFKGSLICFFYLALELRYGRVADAVRRNHLLKRMLKAIHLDAATRSTSRGQSASPRSGRNTVYMLVMRLNHLLIIAALCCIVGCNSSAAKSTRGEKRAVKLLNVSYDPTRELYADFNKVFPSTGWKKRAGRRDCDVAWRLRSANPGRDRRAEGRRRDSSDRV